MVIRLRYLIILFALVLSINIVSAGFEVGNVSHSIKDIYGSSDYINGWVNISLINEPSNSIFGDTEGNSIDLIDLINASRDYIYSCTPIDCQTDYSASNAGTTKTFSLNSGESEIFGLGFDGNIVKIDSISFDIQSNAPASCNNQLKVDFLDDGTIEAANNKISNELCSSVNNYGCFDSSKSLDEYKIDVIGHRPYCQRIELSEAPGFKIGTWIKNVSGLSETLVMALYDSGGSQIETCELPEIIGEGEFSCDVDHLVTKTEDHYVCIYSLGGNPESVYEIKGYSDNVNGCGFYNNPIPTNSPAAYQIFASGKKFDSMDGTTLSISNTLASGDSLGEIARNYIIERYGSLDCSINNCVVPIRFISGQNQDITINNLQIQYEKVSGVVTGDKFHNLTEIPAIINSEFQKLYLDNGNFSVPEEFGNYTFSLSLGGNGVFSEEVSVEDIPKINFVKPTKTASAFPTEFVVDVDSSSGIITYDWDFGDNGITKTSNNATTHTYQATGIYKLKITTTDFNGFSSSETFDINVSLPKELINNTLIKIGKDIDKVKIQIKAFDSFTQESLNTVLGIDFIEKELRELETNFTLAISEEDYNRIISRLLNLDVPESITKIKSADFISFYPERENIDVDILQVIGGGSFDKNEEEAYREAILIWNLENLETKIDFEEFSAQYESSSESAVKIFKLRLNEIGNVEENSYFIIRKLDDLKFDKDYQEVEESGYVYINLSNFPTTITFSTTEDIYFVDLPSFVSPPLSRLSISEAIITDDEEGVSKWTIFILIIFFLALIGLITYIVLQQWYKKKYENYLFKNKNDLYNMVTYVNNAKKKGLKRREISGNLKKAGWSSEKVRYVMRKYAGRGTGMLELPITKVLDKMKKR